MSSPGLNVIALISGGKDSLYSILHCIRNGHRVVALANLHPPLPEEDSQQQQEDEDDMDSFMYQTIGHNIIPLYETALGIPLYRAPIMGDAVDTSRIYGNDSTTTTAAADAKAEDETESLMPLLKRIKRDIPHANAVSAGAILSTYQRTRIENVAGRLGLVPLAWLWMYTELPRPESVEPSVSGLLEDMAAVGCEARIIKAASGGLDEGSLWENVSAHDGLVRRRLEKAMRRFAVDDLEQAVLGEGGEYETLALDGPGFLWKQRIVVEDSDRGVRSVGGGVCYSTIKEAKCVPKEAGQGDIKPEDIRRPARLDDSFQWALEDVLAKNTVPEESVNVQSPCQPLPTIDSHTAANDTNSWSISNVTAPEAGSDAGAQMHGISAKLQDVFSARGVASTDDIVFTTILLRSMKDFAPMNETYVSLFSKPNPPARVTVACGDCLPDGVQIMASFTIDLGTRHLRKGLHVQSRSYWAPANIGPYSQAITVPCQLDTPVETSGGLVFIAGQIPLDPASMEFPTSGLTGEYDDFGLHATLSLQHLWRIGRATQVDWWLGGIAFLARDDDAHQQRIRTKAQLAHKLWQAMNKPAEEEDEEQEDAELDVWDIKHGLREDPRSARRVVQPLPNFERVDNDNNNISDAHMINTPLFAVEVEALPRASAIEWQALGTTCSDVTLMTVDSADAHTRIWRTRLSNTEFYTIGFGKASTEHKHLDDRIDTVVSKLQCDFATSHATVYLANGVSISQCRAQVIPCRSIWGDGGQAMAAVMTIRLSK
jgi:diphthine-ammonia ligase